MAEEEKRGIVFITSKVYEQAVGALDIYRCITLVGPSGCGKTLTALQLASRKCEKDGGSKLYFRQTLEEILAIAKNDINAYIIVDDWIDKYLYFPSTLYPAIDCLNKTYVKYIKDTKIHLILTAQEDKWNRIRSLLNACCLFNEPHLLTINSKIFSQKGKRNMVLRHFECFDIEEKEDSVDEETSNLMKRTTFVQKGTVDNIVMNIKEEQEFSFPLVVDLICNNIRLLRTLDCVFKYGFEETLTKYFDTWSNDTYIKEKRSFCILVFAALLGGEISPRDLSAQKTGAMYKRICREYACQSNANISVQKETDGNELIEQQSELFETNLRLKSCLYRSSKGQGCPCFVFQHSSLVRFVLLYIKKRKGESFIIKNATIEVLLNKCWLEVPFADKIVNRKKYTSLKSLEGSVIFSKKYFLPLAERILSEMQNGECIPEWDKHVFLSNEKFLKVWNSIDTSHVKDIV
ncbi:uncharacterized protein LOC128176674 [Crassostrea angulata]|uniref:uncharacterized protein LOC128176674 n=1 Tax=Magallana angulata TaxID=2784310 RepID=UPI0022B0CF30|nr:uncharacterized protein LOC128176674 [Crassostrea angulata]